MKKHGGAAKRDENSEQTNRDESPTRRLKKAKGILRVLGEMDCPKFRRRL